MPWPFSALSRWLDRRIDDGISARRSQDRLFDEIATRKKRGDDALIQFATAAIRDVSAIEARRRLRIEHGLDAAKHGLSLERIPFDLDFPITDFFGSAPPIGELFVEVIAIKRGDVLIATGTRLPDNVVSYVSRTRMSAQSAKALALALLRAAEISERAASTTQPRTGERSSPDLHAERPAHVPGGAA